MATGEGHLLLIPPAAVRSLVDRNPALVERLRRINQTRDEHQAATVEALVAAAGRQGLGDRALRVRGGPRRRGRVTG